MIEGMDKLLKRIQRMKNVSLKEPVGRAIDMVQQHAVGKVHSHKNTGELERSIYSETESRGEKTVGTCWSNSKQGFFMEFGTGPKASEGQERISPHASVPHVQSPWWIHESQIDRELAEKYHWFYIDTPEGRFYQCTGQPARPFMYPALKDHEDEVVKMISDGVRGQIK